VWRVTSLRLPRVTFLRFAEPAASWLQPFLLELTYLSTVSLTDIWFFFSLA
jgi:hypothetical protein